jgi:hypothetical protein
MFHFNSQDGPVPPHIHIDDPGWQPTKPDRQEEITLVQDFLARLRAENEHNKRTAVNSDS